VTAATKSFWKSTHPWGDVIRIADLRVLSITALALGLLATATVTTMFYASGYFSFERMNYYLIGKIVGGGTFEAPLFALPSVAGFVITPLVAVAVGFLGSYFDGRARQESRQPS